MSQPWGQHVGLAVLAVWVSVAAGDLDQFAVELCDLL